jgi:hypothetical protein
MSAKQRQQWNQTTWEAAHEEKEHDPDQIRREILPGLATVRMAAATGMSTSAASKIRAGRRIRHPRYWEALGALERVEVPVLPRRGSVK